MRLSDGLFRGLKVFARRFTLAAMKLSMIALALVVMLGVAGRETPHGTIVAGNMRDNTATV